MENQSAHFDVAIVGSGLVGTCLALQLAPMPLSIALIDRQPAGADSTVLQEVITRPTLSCQDFSPRVSALSLATRQLMQQLGVWDELPAARVCDYSGMEVWDADGTGSIRFNAEELAQDALGSIVENHHLLAALGSRLAGESALTHFPGREIEALHQAADSGQAAQIQFTGGETLSARLVVGADGAQSPVRALAGFETREWDYHHSALVATVRTSLPHKKTAMQRFMTSGPLAFLPLQNDSPGLEEQFTSIVWSLPPDLCEAKLAMTDDAFRSELAAAMEGRAGSIEEVGKRFAFALRQRHARRYFQGSVVLAGDAAHTIHPLAGQGVNLGFQDTVALASELGRALRTGRSLADPVVLGRYQRRRLGHNLGMMWMMQGFKDLFEQRSPELRWLRNLGLRTADRISPLKQRLALEAMGIQL